MKRIRFSQLTDITDTQIFAQIMPGAYIRTGALAFSAPGERSHSHPGEPRDRHVHKDIETFCILQGKGKLEINGEFHDIAAGDILAVEPGEDHHLISDTEDPIVVLWMHAGDTRSDNHNPTEKG